MKVCFNPAFYISGIILLLCGCASRSQQGASRPPSAFYMPAQFEEQAAVWLGWEAHEPYYPVNIAMVKAMYQDVLVKVVSESDSVSTVAKQNLLKAGIDTSRLQFQVMQDNQFWMRDHGAAFVVNNEGAMQAVDFQWSLYGYADWLAKTYKDTARLASFQRWFSNNKRNRIDSLMGVAAQAAVIKSWITIEGGGIEVNGKGTLLLNEPLTLARNNGASKDSIAAEFRKVLGVNNIIWLQHGLADDPHIWQIITGDYVGLGTGGHTDEYVKFADENTILLAWVPEEEKEQHPINRINYERMSINYQILKAARNVDGKPFHIIKVPLPHPIEREVVLGSRTPTSYDTIPVNVFPASMGFKVGDRLKRVAASSYLNYYVTNGVVLLPDYSNQGASNAKKQEEVRQIFTRVFPGRKLVFMDAMALNWNGGGIHCGTQQEPKRKK